MNLDSLKQFATPRQCQIIDAVISHGSQAKAATALGINHRGLERTLKRAKEQAARQGWSPQHDYVHSVPDTHIVKGVSTFYDEDGKPIRQWVKSDLKKESQEAALQAFADSLMEDLPKYKPTPRKPIKDLPEQLTAIVIGDAHIGMKVSNSRNKGEGEWTLEIAEAVTLEAVSSLIKATGGSDTALLLDLGDFQHFDNQAGTTTSGNNHMDMDGDYGEMIAACQRIYRQSIEMMLESHNNIIVMMVRGNHNDNTSRVINVMLQGFYENEPRVTIMDNAHKFQNFIYGNNLLVTHHGDRMKPQRAFEYVARSLAKDWGLPHKHLLMGHVHHHTAVEIGGMLCETFQALPAPDAWHSDSGYGAKRTMSAIVYDKQHGEIQRHKVGIGQLEAAA